MGFDFTGFEIDGDHFYQSIKRFNNVTKQLTIFGT